MFCEVTATFDHQNLVSLSLSQSLLQIFRSQRCDGWMRGDSDTWTPSSSHFILKSKWMFCRNFPQDISVIVFLKMVGTDVQPQNIMSPALKCTVNDKINQVMGGCGSGVVHVEVSLGKTLNPKLLPICWPAPCMAATSISVWMYVWITVSRFGQKRLLNALKC